MDNWKLDDDSKSEIENIIELIRNHYICLADTSYKLIAIGEVWSALESIISGDDEIYIDCNTSVSIGRKVRFDGDEEGIFYELRINEQELILDKLTTTYSKSIGSDWSSKVYLNVNSGAKDFSIAIQEWMSDVLEIVTFDDTFLSCSRDHV